MKAARVQDGKLTLIDDPTPEPAPDYARVRITSAGVCHSDLHLRKGDWGLPGEGMPLGHEAIGIVEALGAGAERYVSVGDRVILGLGGAGGGEWCGACEYCIAGEPRHCSRNNTLMGTFAEEFVAFAPGLVPIPDSIPDTEAPLACGGLTAYRRGEEAHPARRHARPLGRHRRRRRRSSATTRCSWRPRSVTE